MRIIKYKVFEELIIDTTSSIFPENENLTFFKMKIKINNCPIE